MVSIPPEIDTNVRGFLLITFLLFRILRRLRTQENLLTRIAEALEKER